MQTILNRSLLYDIEVVSVVSLVDDVLLSFDQHLEHAVQNLRELLLQGRKENCWSNFQREDESAAVLLGSGVVPLALLKSCEMLHGKFNQVRRRAAQNLDRVSLQQLPQPGRYLHATHRAGSEVTNNLNSKHQI
ncbi:hypothetical protein EYF80_004181 [Liparis tanakae]|uniref:Uncharacterized protein n=1 Tax=Liparis tanakae TaxID=230148 RepID=A0A4Z2J785_9TELE|nr:hypothetical protein EYF80_004181 [Liparis tanakae]